MKKTFFLISNMYPNEESPGYGSFVKNICDNLSKYNITEEYNAVITGKSKSKIHKIYKYLRFYFQILFKFWRKYDFIYLHFPNHASLILYPLLIFKKKNLVVNLHGEDLMYRQSFKPRMIGKMMEKMCTKFANAIVVPSEYFKNVVIDRGFFPPEKIIVSPSGGINEKYFIPKDLQNLQSDTLHIGYVGRLEKDKGILEFLEVCERLKSKRENFRGIIIGYGSLYEYTESFLNKSNLFKQIDLIQGVNQSRLGEYYRRMDILIFSSSRTGESLGLIGIEAMACGTPVIGSAIGGIKTYLKQEYNGWLTPIHDIEGIIQALNKYKKLSPREKQEISINCRTTAKAYLSENVAKELATELRKLT